MAVLVEGVYTFYYNKLPTLQILTLARRETEE